MYNLLIGGAAGDGIETMAGMLEKILLRSGYHVFSLKDFMSRVRGGHNFTQLRFAAEPVAAHRDELDGIVAFNQESYELHAHRLSTKGFVLCDSSLENVNHERVIKVDLRGMAKQAGNPKTIGTVATGALLKLFGVATNAADQTFQETLKPKVLDANREALRLGYESVERKFESTPGDTKGKILVTGSDAVCLGALAGGIKFYSAYPMSPSTELLSFFTRKAADFKIALEQAEDEIAAINMALGASYAGARAMVGTSGGGFALMVEALGFAGLAEIPVVIADMQRPGPATGLPTRTEQSDLLFTCFAAQGEFPRLVIALRDHADAMRQTARAFRLAWKYQMPVLLLGDQYMADSAVTIPLPDEAVLRHEGRDETKWYNGAPGEYKRYALSTDGISPLLVPGKTGALVRVDSDEHEENGTITESALVRTQQTEKRFAKLDTLRTELEEPEYLGHEKPEVLLLGFGSTAGALREAVAMLQESSQYRIGALLFGDIYPLPEKLLRKYAENAPKILSVEQNATAQLAKLVQMETGITVNDSILKYDGRQLSVDDILYRTSALLV